MVTHKNIYIKKQARRVGMDTTTISTSVSSRISSPISIIASKVCFVMIVNVLRWYAA